LARYGGINLYTPPLQRWRQEDCECKISLIYKVITCLKEGKKERMEGRKEGEGGREGSKGEREVRERGK
jgi:hypothetical protein